MKANETTRSFTFWDKLICESFKDTVTRWGVSIEETVKIDDCAFESEIKVTSTPYYVELCLTAYLGLME